MAKRTFSEVSTTAAIEEVQDFERANSLLIKKLSTWAAPEAPAASVYAHGWQAKLNQAAFALQSLEVLAQNPCADGTTTTTELLTYSAKISFYTDAFWAFLYATFDISAQLGNQVLQVGTVERGVNLNANFVGTWPAGPVKDIAKKIIESDVYDEANHYRNTSLHRREICIDFEEFRSAVSTAYIGVMTTGPSPMSRRPKHLCDDPFIVQPTFGAHKPIIGFSAFCLGATAKHLKKVANALKKAVP